MENNDHIDDHLKETLRHFEVQPKLSSFDTIQRKMEKKKRRRFFLWFFTGCIGLLGGLLLLYPALFGPPDLNNNQTLSDHITASAPEKKQDAQTLTDDKTIIKKSASNSSPSKSSSNTPEETLPAPSSTLPLPETPSAEETLHDGKSVRSSAIKTKAAEQNVNEPVKSPGKSPIKTPLTTKEKIKLLSPEKTMSTQPAQPLLTGQEDIKDKNVNGKTDTIFAVQADHLDPVVLFMPDVLQHTTEPAAQFNELPLSVTDTAKKNKPKRLRFLLGINFDPQFVTYQYAKNKKHDPEFDMNYGKPFSELYLKEKRKQNKLSFGYSFGLKFGAVISDKWEIMAGAGLLRYKEAFKPRKLTDSVLTLGLPVRGFVWNTNEALDRDAIEGNIFRYSYYSLEAARYFTVKRFTKVKAGFGLQMNNLRRSNYYVVYGADRYSYTFDNGGDIRIRSLVLNAKLGFIQDMGKHFQFHASPTLFYTPGSMYSKNYVIKQRPYGLKLECLLLFRF